jgi:hypothetical protein
MRVTREKQAGKQNAMQLIIDQAITTICNIIVIIIRMITAFSHPGLESKKLLHESTSGDFAELFVPHE